MAELMIDEHKSDDCTNHAYSSFEMSLYNVSTDDTDESLNLTLIEDNNSNELRPKAQLLTFNLSDAFLNA